MRLRMLIIEKTHTGCKLISIYANVRSITPWRLNSNYYEEKQEIIEKNWISSWRGKNHGEICAGYSTAMSQGE